MEGKWTKGPWMIGYCDGSGIGEDYFCITDGMEPIVRGDDYDLCPMGVLRIEDARLIAESPAMFDIIQELAKVCCNCDDGCIHDKAREIEARVLNIAAALGKEG